MEASAFAPRALLARRQDDRGLLAAALEGDAVAFAEVYRRHHARIHGFCLARLADAEAAADVTQEVFIRVLRSDAADIENPTAWLYAIARNAIVDAQRAAGRRPVPSEIDDSAATVNGLAPADAHEVVESGHDIDAVMLAMRAIAPRYRTAIVLRDIKGLSSADAAAALKTSTGALDTLLHRARRALSKEHERLATLAPACVRAHELLHAADPASVTASDAQALDVHLLGCEVCRKERSRIQRRRALQALLPFIFPLERSVDSISRVALLASHPVVRFAAVSLAVAAVAAAPVRVALRPASVGPTLRSPAPVSRPHVGPRASDVVDRLTARSGAAERMSAAATRMSGTTSPMMGRTTSGMTRTPGTNTAKRSSGPTRSGSQMSGTWTAGGGGTGSTGMGASMTSGRMTTNR